MKKLLVMLSVLLLSACSWDQAKDIAAITTGSVIVSDSVDSLKTELGEYSVNQETIVKLTLLQDEIKTSLTEPADSITVQSFYFRARSIYMTLSMEIADRRNELTAEQRARLNMLDIQLMELNRKVLSFKDDTDNSDLIAISKGVLNVLSVSYDVFKVYKGVSS